MTPFQLIHKLSNQFFVQLSFLNLTSKEFSYVFSALVYIPVVHILNPNAELQLLIWGGQTPVRSYCFGIQRNVIPDHMRIIMSRLYAL